jgi:hypothetical protein
LRPVEIVAEIEQLPVRAIVTSPDELLTVHAVPEAEYEIVPSLAPADGVAVTENVPSPYTFE